MSQTLGMEKRKLLFVAQGVVSTVSIVQVINNLICFVGMTPARECRIDTYPYKEKGGCGYTGYFPLMESYIMVDAYTDLDHTEILLSTCKPHRADPFAIKSLLTKLIGPTEFIGTL